MALSGDYTDFNAVDFAAFITAPANAIINSQFYIGVSTIEFIKSYGFGGVSSLMTGRAQDLMEGLDGMEALMVEFEFEKPATEEQTPEDIQAAAATAGGEGGGGQEKEVAEAATRKLVPMTLSIPFLCMMQIPNLRITAASIDFKCKIGSITTKNSMESENETRDQSFGVNLLFFNASVSTSSSNGKTNSDGSQESSEYSMDVSVQFESAPQPAGIARLQR
eukprot:CAMPEP_0177682816 /NCGR_PEP_ID=MMETSP0447-20121125/31453_1 /TAXON_ID=0 /ORGANISM="Stygamoeba regulata, Strain BSH-02190019" /LENGTH=220 /DNA_ID=CAMNT_0019192329 /DNA_START=160 /DNA_END=819 /DNA_ORIENTATION=+